MSDRLAGFNFAQHNAEVKALWDTFPAGKAPRVPIVFGTNARYFMVNTDANPDGLEFRQYTENPDVMFDTLLRFQRWSRFNLLQDAELGLPERWNIAPDFQNYYEAAYFGSTVEYFPGQVPDTQPEFVDVPERVMEQGIPEPFTKFGAKTLTYFERFQARAKRETFLDRPITITAPLCGTDGVMTVACNLFGASFVCEAMACESERLHKLFDFITEATIRRMTAWRKLGGIPVPNDGFGFADDSVAMISTEMYREHVLPYHRRLCNAFSATTQLRGIHLCGDSTRHFRTIRDELNVQVFDTGFPVNFGGLRQELGPLVRLQGGPHIELLRSATPVAIRAEVQRVLQTGVTDGRRFVLREGNNLAPATPLENTEALYKAGREFGKFQ
ncbi:MAG: uroporphyrinogen decarboxylase family protein [Verrucomicrobiota bacterium]